jgi:hypothetical protein
LSVNLVKMCVGIESVEHLALVQAQRMENAREAGDDPTLRHITRHMPKRAPELCEDGSIYWVVRGFIAVRQRILACERRLNSEGRPSCGLVLDPNLVRTQLKPSRPFQGWRYLKVEKTPPDLTNGEDSEAGDIPSEMANELRNLGLL